MTGRPGLDSGLLGNPERNVGRLAPTAQVAVPGNRKFGLVQPPLAGTGTYAGGAQRLAKIRAHSPLLPDRQSVGRTHRGALRLAALNELVFFSQIVNSVPSEGPRFISESRVELALGLHAAGENQTRP